MPLYVQVPDCMVCVLHPEYPWNGVVQEFFAKDMGLPLTMTPNYDDFSCQ